MRHVAMTALILTTALASLPGPAAAFNGKRNTRAFPVNDQVFEVIASTAGSGGDYWCGAADYARRILGLPWQARITVVQGRAPSVTTNRKTAVQFTIDQAAGQAPGTFEFRFGDIRAGDSRKVQDANRECVRPTLRGTALDEDQPRRVTG